MRACEVEVAKIGGSLLQKDNFVPSFRAWLKNQSTNRPKVHLVLIVGGGLLVEALRELDETTPLGKHEVHWRAIDLMQVTGRMLKAWLPELAVADSLAAVQERCCLPGCTLFLSREFLEHREPTLPGERLPAGWQVTSDSIAARLAICLQASRLRLLKSRPPTRKETECWQHAAEQGFVDRFFPRLASQLPHVTCETLSADPPATSFTNSGGVPTDNNGQDPAE